MEGYSFFALNVPSHGCDLIDNRIGRLHTNFHVSATLSKKVLIFPQKFKYQISLMFDVPVIANSDTRLCLYKTPVLKVDK